MSGSPALVPLLAALVVLFVVWLFVMYLCLKRVFEHADRRAAGDQLTVDMLMGREIQPSAETARSRMMATGV